MGPVAHVFVCASERISGRYRVYEFSKLVRCNAIPIALIHNIDNRKCMPLLHNAQNILHVVNYG